MKLKRYSLINESYGVDDHFKISKEVISMLKSQNPIIDDVEDLFADILDIWGHDKIPYYCLLVKLNSKEYSIDFITSEMFEYFKMSESDYDHLDGHYKSAIDILSNIRNGTIKDINLRITYQYANAENEWNYYTTSDEFKLAYNELESRINKMGGKTFLEKKEVEDNEGKASYQVWSTQMTVPVNLSLGNTIDKLDGVSDLVITKYNDFVKDYRLDNVGQSRLSDLIRTK